MNGDQLKDLIDGMDANGLLEGIHSMLTGYIGSASFVMAVAEVVSRVKEQNPNLRYICDPVLGDNGKYYTPMELTELFKEHVLP